MTDEGFVCPFMSDAEKCVVCRSGYLGMSKNLEDVIRKQAIQEYGDKPNMADTLLKLAIEAMPGERCAAWSEFNGWCIRLHA